MAVFRIRSQRDVTQALLGYLTRGFSPGRVAFTLALGMTLSCFPLLGVTTILCALVAIVFRLSLPVIEAGNYLALPLQMILLLPFVRLGERMFHSQAVPLSPGKMLSMVRASPDQAMHLLVTAQGHAIAAWAVVAPGMLLLFTLLLFPLLRILLDRAATTARPPAISHSNGPTLQGN
ncbi:MAG TPA: DUF2062 domain-containing protein [Acidisarcina sp.]